VTCHYCNTARAEGDVVADTESSYLLSETAAVVVVRNIAVDSVVVLFAEGADFAAAGLEGC